MGGWLGEGNEGIGNANGCAGCDRCWCSERSPVSRANELLDDSTRGYASGNVRAPALRAKEVSPSLIDRSQPITASEVDA